MIRRLYGLTRVVTLLVVNPQCRIDSGHERTKDMLLRHLENRSTLPKVYRREDGVR
jgi:hypothetical protein